jgi:hypothetical protein
MTSERAKAYGQVMAALEGVGPTKLAAGEEQVLREAADALLFCRDLRDDPEAREAAAEAEALLERLVDSERWLDETAARLRSDLEACGPMALAA